MLLRYPKHPSQAKIGGIDEKKQRSQCVYKEATIPMCIYQCIHAHSLMRLTILSSLSPHP